MSDALLLEDQFEHDFCIEKDGQLIQGDTGSIEEIAVQKNQIRAVFGFNFDLDIKDFHRPFVEIYRSYLGQVLPSLGLTQTSARGNLHGFLQLEESITLKKAEFYHRFLKDFLFADGASKLVMYRRQPRTINSKQNDQFVVREIQPAVPVSGQELDELARPEKEGDAIPFWLTKSFDALFQFATIEGRPYWRQGRSHGVCPLHGSGSNDTQCSYHPREIRVACWGECSPGGDQPKSISYRQILEQLVFQNDLSGRFQLADMSGDTLIWQPDSVDKNQELMQRLAACGEYVRMDKQLYKINEGEIISLADSSKKAVGKHWTTSIKVQQYNAQRGEIKPYNFKAEEVESILTSHIGELPEVKYRLHRSALKDDGQWSKIGLDGHYFTHHGITAPIPENGRCPNFNQLLDMWPWKAEVDRTNAMATFLNRIFCGLSSFAGKHLTTIISGNQQGVGKTELANCVLLLAQDSTNTLLTESEVLKGDFERSLVPIIKDRAVTAILIDNIVGSSLGKFNSNNIVPLITDKRLAHRLFYSQSQLNLANNLQWLLTTNGASYSNDLIDRSILVEIAYQGDPTRRHSPTSPTELVEAKKELLHAEAVGMYQNWLDQGQPSSQIPGRNFQFFSCMNSVLVCNGFHGFDSNRQTLRSSAADPETELLTDIFSIWAAQDSAERLGMSSSELLISLQVSTKSRFCGEGAPKSQQTRLGIALKNLVGRELFMDGEIHRFQSRMKNNGHKFYFAQIESSDHVDQPVENDMLAGIELTPDITAENQPTPLDQSSQEPDNFGGSLDEIFQF